MLIDYKDNYLYITEEHNESFLLVQDKSAFNLCSKITYGKFRIPYVTLPIIQKAIKSLKYPIRYSDRLKEYHQNLLIHRQLLNSLKTDAYKSSTDPRIQHILQFIRDEEEKIKLYFKDFTGFYGNQIDTIIYGIIGERIIIGNDIGTGKSLTAVMIAKYLMKYKSANKCLILLPASLATNFYQDYNKFFSDGECLLIGSQTKQKRRELYRTALTSSKVKFLITNYQKCNFDYEFLKHFKFDILVVDEFHRMKNFKTAEMSIKFFQMVDNSWKPRYRYPMSGTPIENKLFDLYPIFKLLDDGYILGGEDFFDSNFIVYKTKFIKVKVNYGDGFKLIKNEVPIDFRHSTFVKSLIEPYIIKKKLDLPVGLYSHDVIITPTNSFLKKYKQIRLSEKDLSVRYMRLRQFLCDTEREDFLENPKFEELENIISQTDSKIIIFSFFKCSIAAISKWLDKNNIKHITCQGGDGTDALEVVNKFKSDPSIKLLLTTDKINFGHNIQEAKIIIEWEKPINPTTSMQRFGRSYRSGQTTDVHTYSFVVSDTVEEIIFERLKEKKEVIDIVIESLTNGHSDYTMDEIDIKLNKTIEDMELGIIKEC